MSFPGNFRIYRSDKPQHPSVKEYHNKGKGDQTIVFRKDAYKEQKSSQHINNATGSNMIRRPSDQPVYYPCQKESVEQNLPADLPIKIKKRHREDQQRNSIAEQMFNAAMDKR